MERIRALAADMHSAYQRPLKDWLAADELPAYAQRWIRSDRLDEDWRSLIPQSGLAAVRTPCLHLGGLYDIFLGGTLKAFATISDALGADGPGSQFLAVGPWQHIPWSRLNGSLDHGEEGDNRAAEFQLASFNHWLKQGPPDPGEQRVRYFLMGADRWEAAVTWPPEDCAPVDLYLRSSGLAGLRLTDGALSAELPGKRPRTSSSSIRGSRFRASAAPRAAGPISLPSAPSTSVGWRAGRTCWSTRRPRCCSRATQSDLSRLRSMRRPMRWTPTGPPSSSTFIPTAPRSTCATVFCGPASGFAGSAVAPPTRRSRRLHHRSRRHSAAISARTRNSSRDLELQFPRL